MNINLKIPENVTANLVRIGFVCNKCHHTWGVYLSPDLTIPVNGDKCLKCASMEIEEKK